MQALPIADRTHMTVVLEKKMDISGFAQILRALRKILNILQDNPPQPLRTLRHEEVVYVLEGTRKVQRVLRM